MKRRVSMSIDDRVIDGVDELVRHLGVSRSGFVEEAMERHLEAALDSGEALRRLADRHVRAVAGIWAVRDTGGVGSGQPGA